MLLWAVAWTLAVLSRVSYRAGWPVPITATLLVVALILAVALLTRRIGAAIRGRDREKGR